MPEYKRYNLTLRVVDPTARDKFRMLSRPESFFEIRPNRRPGERGAYSVLMTQEEYEAALEDADNPESNLIVIEPSPPRRPWPSVPGAAASTYVALDSADSLGLTGSGVTVGDIDSGISEAIAGSFSIVGQKAFNEFEDGSVGTGTSPYGDYSGHGSRMSGLAVPPAASLAMAKSGSADSGPSDGEAAAGAYWLADEIGVDVMLFEMQGEGSQVLQDAVAHAISKNIIVVAPMGNGGQANAGGPGEKIALAPARYSGVLAISNYSTDTDAIQSSSNYGNSTWAAAPGDVVTTYQAGGGEQTFSGDTGGTSAASAMATGIVARFMTGGRSPGNVVSYLASNARPTGASPIYEGNGVLQLTAAEQQLQQDQPEKTDLAGSPMTGTDGEPLEGAAALDGTGNPEPGACD